ncbi:MAG: Fic family protein, partial [Alcaligenaceae bacterium]
MPNFVHHDLRLLNPRFDSPLLDVLTDLEFLRRLEISGDTPPSVFFQLKHVFHMLESLSSARIEGNHTTLADYLEVASEPAAPDDQLREIKNIEAAMSHIDEAYSKGVALTEHSIRELHEITVRDLVREGDKRPGAYRGTQISISQAEHLPPPPLDVPAYM